jgi:hypothetical protein
MLCFLRLFLLTAYKVKNAVSKTKDNESNQQRPELPGINEAGYRSIIRKIIIACGYVILSAS